MKLSTVFLLALGAFANQCTAAPSYYETLERACGKSLENLWLDVVVAVDNSKGMTNLKLGDIAASIATIFSKVRMIGEHYNARTGENKMSTRVGLVTYNQNATTVADLNTFNSIDDLESGVFDALNEVSDTETSYVATGLNAAETMLKNGAVERRSHFRKVVIIYASTYKDSGKLHPVPVAERLRSNGVKIITVAFGQSGDSSILEGLGKLASRGSNFTNNGDGLNGDIQESLLQANCFCPNDYKQYREDFDDKDSFRYGTCLHSVSLPASRRAADRACRVKGSDTYLVNEFSQQKHNFVQTLARKELKASFKYFIGLQKRGSSWYWDQPMNVEPVALGYKNWMPGFPTSSDPTMTAVWNNGDASQEWWENVKPSENANYICEKIACDTDNYCDGN